MWLRWLSARTLPHVYKTKRPRQRARAVAKHHSSRPSRPGVQEKEARNQLQSAVDEDGSLLDNLTLELRVHPPSIEIDNHSHEQWTTVTIDSANRPGSLIYVRAFCALQAGLHVSRAQPEVLHVNRNRRTRWSGAAVLGDHRAVHCFCWPEQPASHPLCNFTFSGPGRQPGCAALPAWLHHLATTAVGPPPLGRRWCNTLPSWTCASAPPASLRTAAGLWMVRGAGRAVFGAGQTLIQCAPWCARCSHPNVCACHAHVVFHLAEANGEKVWEAMNRLKHSVLVLRHGSKTQLLPDIHAPALQGLACCHP